jgi:hypothetical protein
MILPPSGCIFIYGMERKALVNIKDLKGLFSPDSRQKNMAFLKEPLAYLLSGKNLKHLRKTAGCLPKAYSNQDI